MRKIDVLQASVRAGRTTQERGELCPKKSSREEKSSRKPLTLRHSSLLSLQRLLLQVTGQGNRVIQGEGVIQGGGLEKERGPGRADGLEKERGLGQAGQKVVVKKR